MALSKKLLTRIAIGVAVAVIIFFIVWKIRNKSTYVTSTLSTATVDPEKIFYSNLSACQNTFTTATLGSVTVHTNISCTNGVVTATTLLPHTYTAGSSSINVQGVSSDGTTTAVTTGYNTVSGTPVTVASATDNHTYTYPAVGGSCSTTPPITQFGYSWLNSLTDVNTQNTIRTGCVTSNVESYMNTKCPWTSSTPSSTAAAGSAEATAYTAYQTYQTNLTVIKDAYANLILTAPQDTSASNPGITVVQAAREADFTGATRVYLQTVCPGYYAQTSTYNPGTTADAALPNTPYNSYTANMPSTTYTGVGFNPSLVTKANILNWAKYASGLSPVVQTNGVYVSGGIFDGSAPLIATGSLYDKSTQPAGVTTFPGVKNWEIAQDIGPGTVTKNGPIQGTTGLPAGTATLTMKT